MQLNVECNRESFGSPYPSDYLAQSYPPFLNLSEAEKMRIVARQIVAKNGDFDVNAIAFILATI